MTAAFCIIIFLRQEYSCAILKCIHIANYNEAHWGFAKRLESAKGFKKPNRALYSFRAVADIGSRHNEEANCGVASYLQVTVLRLPISLTYQSVRENKKCKYMYRKDYRQRCWIDARFRNW